MPCMVVTNAGPLMALAKLNLLHLLEQLYGQVHVPAAVYQEAVVSGMQQGYADAYTLRLFLQQRTWQPISTPIPADLNATPLDQGEKEAIALALARNGLLLMDEERGRQEARQRGLIVRGTLGILIESYNHNLIDAGQLHFYFAQIQEHTDIWISPSLCRRLLRETLDSSVATLEDE